MLHKSVEPRSPDSYPSPAAASPFDQIDLRWMVSAVLQHRWMIIAVPAIFTVLAIFFVIGRSPNFTASTQLELTNLRLAFSREDALFAETHPDPTFLETQLQIIRSDRVALNVLTHLQMIAADASAQSKAEALKKLRQGFSAERVGLSNVVALSYSSSSPEMAAQLANEFARAYVAEQNAARWDAAQAGSGWLRDRLREIGPKARVIAEALPPPHKSNMRGLLIIVAAGMVGGVLAVAGAFLWKFLDRRILTPEEAAAATGAECLGIIPRFAGSANASRTDVSTEPQATNSFSADMSSLSYALDHPNSEAWSTLRNVKAACEDCFGGKGLRYLGIISTFAGEGRSTVAANLALSLAASGKSVLLVDCDIYDPVLSRTFAGPESIGLRDYLRDGQASFGSHVLVEQRTGLNFLPLGTGSGANGDDIWTNNLRRFFEETLTSYEYVIFDIPTLGNLADIRAAARYLDGFLLVVGWRKVTAEAARLGATSSSVMHERLLGTVLNNVDSRETRWLLSSQVNFLNKSVQTDELPGVVETVRRVTNKTSRSKKVLVKVALAFILAAATMALLP